MNISAALEQVLKSYEAYYTVRRNPASAPFAAEAEFHVHGERYFLVKQAKYAELESHEYVFFAAEPVLTPDRVRELSARAWNEGVSRVCPSPVHRASDVLLIIVTGAVTPEADKAARSIRFSKSYRLGLQGYSHFRLAAIDPATLRVSHNRMGEELAKSLANLLKKEVE